ncbi:MAG: hypothetical protein JNM93_12955 [Bacteriovoracaceae bacterium]|nr:hypothetical protein [Bacteriovoracaceae bacterium]
MPSILRRIKKKEYQGFKEFVRNLETTPLSRRVEIMQSAILEDPVYMTYAFKNMATPDEVLNYANDNIDAFIKTLPNAINTLAKAFYKTPKIDFIKNTVLPKGLAKDFEEELNLLKDLKQGEKEAAGYMLVKTFRDLQEQEYVYGKAWNFPPAHILKEETGAKQEGHTILQFENGQTAAEGEVVKANREGVWVHYYENGVIMARGNWKGGSKEGEWTFWHSNGKKKAQGVYKEDAKVEGWQYFDREGQPQKK